MKLLRVAFHQYHIDPWGNKAIGSHYEIIDQVDVWENGEFKMYNNGYEPEYACPVWESNDGRTWVAVQNRIDYWGGTWYWPLFNQGKLPGVGTYEIGPSTGWDTYEKVAKMKLVNSADQAVDIEGNLL